MRLLTLRVYPPSYLRDFYEARPQLASLDYAEQFQAIIDDRFGVADYWEKSLTPLGYEVWEPIGNAEFLQKQWAREHDVRFAADRWFEEITAAQVASFQPEVIFAPFRAAYSGKTLEHLSGLCERRPVIVGWSGAPGVTEETLAAYDLVLSCILGMVDDFRRAGHRSELMHHAFEPSILGLLEPDGQAIPVSFIGSVVKGRGYHKQREAFLRDVIEAIEVEIWSDVSVPPVDERIRHWTRRRAFDVAKRLGRSSAGKRLLSRLPVLSEYARMRRAPVPPRHVDPAIARRARPGLYGLEMFQHLQDSEITLNSHIDAAGGYASNMRLFEATGVGACLLTEAYSNLAELFEPGVEVVAYSSVDDAIDKILYLQDNPDRRHAIAAAGQQRTLRCHTFAHRALELNEFIRSAIRSSP